MGLRTQTSPRHTILASRLRHLYVSQYTIMDTKSGEAPRGKRVAGETAAAKLKIRTGMGALSPHGIYCGMRTPTYIAITSFAESAADIRSVRDAVFGQEQSVAREIDFDDQDPHCVHVVATDAGGTPIGTGRMQPDGRIGRLSVLKQWRRQGIGARMLEALVASARGRGSRRCTCTRRYRRSPSTRRGDLQGMGPSSSRRACVMSP